MTQLDIATVFRRVGVAAELRDGEVVLSEVDARRIADMLDAQQREIHDLQRATTPSSGGPPAWKPAELRQAAKFLRRRSAWLRDKLAGLERGTAQTASFKGELAATHIAIALIHSAGGSPGEQKNDRGRE